MENDKIEPIKSFNFLLKKSLYAIFPSKKRMFLILIILFLLSKKIYKISYEENTILHFQLIIDITNNLIAILFGALFTGYSILYTLIRKEILQILVSFPHKKIKKNCKKRIPTIWEYMHYSIIGTLLSFFMILAVNYIFNVFFSMVEDNWFLVITNDFNNLICLIFLFLYLGFTLNAIFEIKSIIYSITQVFNFDNTLKLREDD